MNQSDKLNKKMKESEDVKYTTGKYMTNIENEMYDPVVYSDNPLICLNTNYIEAFSTGVKTSNIIGNRRLPSCI